jgi:hypothetical protein
MTNNNTQGTDMTAETSIDIDKLEQLTEARKGTWRDLHAAFGAYKAATEFAERMKEARDIACRADEAANTALFDFVRSQTEAK